MAFRWGFHAPEKNFQVLIWVGFSRAQKFCFGPWIPDQNRSAGYVSLVLEQKALTIRALWLYNLSCGKNYTLPKNRQITYNKMPSSFTLILPRFCQIFAKSLMCNPYIRLCLNPMYTPTYNFHILKTNYGQGKKCLPTLIITQQSYIIDSMLRNVLNFPRGYQIMHIIFLECEFWESSDIFIRVL